jgi:hypothetical protein
VTAPPPWSLRSPTPNTSLAATSTGSTASTWSQACEPAVGARNQSLGLHQQRGGHHPHHRPKLARLARKYGPLVPALRELIPRPDTPLEADVKDMIAGQLDAAQGRFAAIAHGPTATAAPARNRRLPRTLLAIRARATTGSRLPGHHFDRTFGSSEACCQQARDREFIWNPYHCEMNVVARMNT